MPESTEFPGTFWAFPDSPDRRAIKDKLWAGFLCRYAGSLGMPESPHDYRSIEFFTPKGITPQETLNRLGSVLLEIGGDSIAVQKPGAPTELFAIRMNGNISTT